MDNHPDWGRRGIEPPNKFSALGDPTRWGATVIQSIPGLAPGVIRIEKSGQIVSAQCRDGYSRAWTLAGTLTVSDGTLIPLDDGLGPFHPDGWVAAAVVSMGVGQLQIIHSFNLRAIVAADEPFYWNSDPSNPFYANPFAGAVPVTLPFIMPGALVGNAINIQIFTGINGSAGTNPVTFTTSLILNPFDPGAK